MKKWKIWTLVTTATITAAAILLTLTPLSITANIVAADKEELAVVTGDGDSDDETSVAPIQIRVRNAEDWRVAFETIRKGGDGAAPETPKVYILNIDGDIPVNGSVTASTSFGGGNNIEVTLAGKGNHLK